jgi:hypothetical protein
VNHNGTYGNQHALQDTPSIADTCFSVEALKNVEQPLRPCYRMLVLFDRKTTTHAR